MDSREEEAVRDAAEREMVSGQWPYRDERPDLTAKLEEERAAFLASPNDALARARVYGEWMTSHGPYRDADPLALWNIVATIRDAIIWAAEARP